MKKKLINKNEIQTMAVGDYFGLDIEELYLVYSPLAGASFVARQSDIAILEEALLKKAEGMSISEDIQDIIESLTNFWGIDPYMSVVSDPSEYTKLSILPNFICNFSCSYCYSAKGRSNQAVDKSKLKAMLDYFIDPNRAKSKDLSIFISGGGEPLISWDIVSFILEYGAERATQKGVTLEISLMTNGSKISSRVIEILKEHDVITGVSFDILEDVQNRQRGKYDEVAESIKEMIAYGYPPSISSVITAANVTRQVEMVEEIIANFNGIRHLNFDPAMDAASFSSPQELNEFYQNFTAYFFKARQLSHQHGMTLDCNIIRKFESLFPRYCQGKLCLTPEGKISVCHSISSPKEKGYESVIYGEVTDDGQIVFDQQKFSSLIAKENNLNENCHSCIAKWHCGGGCLMYRENYTGKMFDSVCIFIRNIIRDMILNRLDYQYRENYDMSLKEYVLNIYNK